MPTLLRRLLLWTAICCASAAPSFFLAHREYDRGAMLLGVALFIAAYTAATSTRAFDRLHRRPFVRRTLYIGYGLRLVLSLVFPIAFSGIAALYPLGLVVFADGLPGLLSVNIVKEIGIVPESFFGTLLTTIVQGALLNAIVFVVMGLVYSFQRIFLKPPPDRLRGFEVVMPSATEPLPVSRMDRRP
jgi:hypothetical protein